ncbi:MAG: ABC transporter transmembrane domain-containing protein [Candidatus Midichloria mitochondrii]|uniref:ABC efflux transporter permease/ATP-binding protein n=1 Tax=Midichloria mitochondrii (strain IricVA) TaxID=696127 RepID=F7XTP9_MIDMI|nr:ABC transporter transmembrane domain-containing protein [Candidatus Midichloria mitochondrii]AEI89258.1 ABC efflux transporter permease/ATP-binding protein [Candidatus Midichloria mitochondrii IricVA]MDJ1288006.1 ABC transporter transmembrane domain-containing protein [Candidatus Midichloria mitochondrii]MDJ1312772.1 ABC transporter transmembrane domain-containing protein [Candidatus Midichloria mitochondrii]MDJ1583340.1 ABC transporter transmembrane domain-containing protein [Candidatus Mid
MIKKVLKKKILDYLKIYKNYLLGVFICLIITSSSVLIMSHSLGYVIDKAIVAKNTVMLDSAMLYFISIALILAIATGLRCSLITLTGEYVVRDIREDMYSKILELSPSFYEDKRTGEILSGLNTDTALLQSVISSISVTMRNSIMLVGSIVMLAISSLKLTIMILAMIPVVLVPIISVSRKLKSIARKYQDTVAELSSESEETISFIKVVQSYTREEYQRRNFATSLDYTVNTGKLGIKTRALLVVVVICLIFGGIGTILWVGGHDVLAGTLSPGQLSTFIFLSLICATTSMSITEAFGEIQKAAGATQRIFEFLNIEPAIKNPKNPVKLISNNRGTLAFKGVYFSYIPQKSVLQNISFAVEPGKMLAIVGESGSGKSTIVQLILRFYDVQQGGILLDGIDIKNLNLADLRNNFGYVGQDPVVFSASAYQNILYGNPDASKEEVIRAAKFASAYNFIQKLPGGFNTFLGEKGTKLSGGQKQRIAIARALLKNPKILLLDEATSALDSKNENLIQNALDKLMKDRTTIVIAHRISTIVNADQILLLKNGHIAARGTHEFLLKSSPEYRKHFSLYDKLPYS